jgi:general secretion pathway protein C
MQALPFGRSGLAQTVLVSLLTLAAVVLLGWVLAYWTWAWLAPRAEPRVEATAVQSGGVASAGAVFGTLPRKQETAAPTGIAIRLLGVAAASSGRRGYAVVQLEAKQILAVREGEDVAPGIRLAEVHADHVILERNGGRETLAWPEKKTSASSAPQAAVPSPPRAAVPVAVPSAAEPVAPRARASAARRINRD